MRSTESPEPLFERLELEDILETEQSLVESSMGDVDDPAHAVKGGKKKKGSEKMSGKEGIAYLDFETFMSVELRVGRVIRVEDHPDADKLMIVSIDDGSDSERTVCAGLKEYYTPDEMTGMNIIFVANLAPRKLRGVMSEGMLLAADDENGNVRLLTTNGDISPGSRVR